jgi:hypothetical protein
MNEILITLSTLESLSVLAASVLLRLKKSFGVAEELNGLVTNPFYCRVKLWWYIPSSALL